MSAKTAAGRKMTAKKTTAKRATVRKTTRTTKMGARRKSAAMA